MNTRRIEQLEEILLALITFELVVLVFLIIGTKLEDMKDTIPLTKHYLQNCNNLTLYPEGCQVLS